MWLDRRAAVAFELRHFPRYYEFTERMLIGLKKKWATDLNFQWPRLIEEIDLTLRHIQRKRKWFSRSDQGSYVRLLFVRRDNLRLVISQRDFGARNLLLRFTA